jgi:TATA-box binding protein (TBP) (component of TFIID and TFIIIB)
MEWVSSEQTGETALLQQISISTITTTKKFNCKFNLHSIYKYVKLDSNNIIGFKCNGWVRIKLNDKIILLPPAVSDSDDEDEEEEEVVVSSKKEKKKKIPSHYNEIKGIYGNLKIKRSKNRFFNQVTAYIKLSIADQLEPNMTESQKKKLIHRYINVKIFKNGSLQMTGIKKTKECNIIINKLFNEIINPINTNTIVGYPTGTILPDFMQIVEEPNTMLKFLELLEPIETPVLLTHLKITDFSIRMINSNCQVPFKINRDILFQLLKKDKIKCRYDPNSHACVNIRYDINDDDKVSIFVFQSGSIIITGGKKIIDINKGYHYIMGIISKHYEAIKKKDLDNYINSLDGDDTDEENQNIINMSSNN